jgi:hypothetical protein
MTSTSISLQRLTVEADKAAAGAEAAKKRVRSAKADLKKARKLSKTAKKAAKLARKKVEAARAEVVPAGLPKAAKAAAGGAKHRVRKKTPRAKGQSAAEVAQAVISRIAASKRSKRSGSTTRGASEAAGPAEAGADSGNAGVAAASPVTESKPAHAGH